MTDRYYKFSEQEVRKPLPFYCRMRFHFFVLFFYLIIQFYTCTLCSKWRHNIKMYKAVPVRSVNLTTSFSNQTQANLTAYLETSLSNSIPANKTIDGTSNINSVAYPDEIPPLYAHALLAFVFHLGVQIFLYVFRTKKQIIFGFAVSYLNWIVLQDVNVCRATRGKYVQQGKTLRKSDERILKKALMMQEKSSLLRCWHRNCFFWKPHVHCSRLTYPVIDCTLTDFMFFNLSYEEGYHILGTIELIHDLMKALDFLHYRNTYHLDLRSDNVKLHCNGLKVYTKLSNFNFMKRAVDKKVSSTAVGLNGYYGPPECSVEQEVDGEKCDTWGLGMIALDLFTGGMFRIKTQSPDWEVSNSEEYIRSFIQRRPFFGYVQGTYKVIEMFQEARFKSRMRFETWSNPGSIRNFQISYIVEQDYKTYNVNPMNFLFDVRCFVYRMLIFNPRRRATLARAFVEPLITNRGMVRAYQEVV